MHRPTYEEIASWAEPVFIKGIHDRAIQRDARKTVTGTFCRNLLTLYADLTDVGRFYRAMRAMQEDMAYVSGSFPFPNGNRPFSNATSDTPVRDARLVARYEGCEDVEAIRVVDEKVLRIRRGVDEFNCVVETHDWYPRRKTHAERNGLGDSTMIGYKKTYYEGMFNWERLQQQRDTSSTQADVILNQDSVDGRTIFTLDFRTEAFEAWKNEPNTFTLGGKPLADSRRRCARYCTQSPHRLGEAGTEEHFGIGDRSSCKSFGCQCSILRLSCLVVGLHGPSGCFCSTTGDQPPYSSSYCPPSLRMYMKYFRNECISRQNMTVAHSVLGCGARESANFGDSDQSRFHFEGNGTVPSLHVRLVW